MGITPIAAASSSGGFNPSTLILILIVGVVVYMLMIRPQRRRREQAQQQQNSVQPGARVRTTAGMYATVVDVDGDDVILEVAPGVEVRYMKRAVMDVVAPADPADILDEDVVPADEAAAGYAAPSSDEVTDTPPASAEPPAANSAADDETAYEQATGTKKD